MTKSYMHLGFQADEQIQEAVINSAQSKDPVYRSVLSLQVSPIKPASPDAITSQCRPLSLTEVSDRVSTLERALNKLLLALQTPR